MSYQVFARKYRPRTFDDVLGQDHVVRTLKNAIEQNRIAHAYLLVGPRGTGKTSMARILSKALNCTGGPRADFDPDESICQEIAEGRCLDVTEIDGASNRGIDHIRDLRDSVHFAPMHGRFRIYYIDEVHMLTTESFNALLKTLEEPPAHVKFIFATTEPNKILATIISRCQRFDLRRIPDHIIANHLLDMAKREGLKLEPLAAQTIARGAEGGMRDAQSMLDQLVAFCGHEIREYDVLNIFGFTSHQTVASLAEAVLKKETPAALDQIHHESDRGKDLSKLLADLIAHLRDLLVYKIGQAPSGEPSTEDAQAIAGQSRLASAERLINLIDQFADVDARMKWAPNKKLYFEIGLIKAIRSLDEVSLSDVIVTLQEAGALSGSGGGSGAPILQAGGSQTRGEVPEAPPLSSGFASSGVHPPAPNPVSAAELWSRLVAELQTRRPLQAGFAAHGTFIAERADELIIGFAPASRMAKESLSREPAKGVVEELLAALAGRRMSLRLETRDDIAPPPPPQKPSLPTAQEALASVLDDGGEPTSANSPSSRPSSTPPAAALSEEQFYNDPLIAEALRLFEARITAIIPGPQQAAGSA
ncbi:MAG: DNA polymerase III subunit gamma/tau [Verrucomicrobiales bacterium]